MSDRIHLGDHENLTSTGDNFRNLFEAITDIVVVGTPEGKILYANAAVRNKLGYTFSELCELGIIGMHSPDQQEEALRIFQAMFRKELEICPLPLVRKDGTLLPVETRVWFGKWDGQECIFGLSKDLSFEQKSLQHFNKLFESNPSLMAVSTLTDRIFTDVNTAFLKTLGFTREEVIGKTSPQLGIVLEPEKLNEVEKQIRSGGSARDILLKIKAKDGRILTGLFAAEIIENQGQQYFLTVMTDLTRLIETEEALVQTENEVAAILKTIPDLLFIIDRNGNFSDIYTDDESKLLVPPDQARGHNLSEFFDEKIADDAMEAIRQSLAENSLVTFPYMIDARGEEEYYEARIVPRNDHQVICMVRDVTSEINAIRTIQENEHRNKQMQELFRNIADNMPDMIWAKDLDKKYIFVNKAICYKLLHATDTNEPIGRTDMFFASRERNSQQDNNQWHTFGEICRDSDSVVMESGETGQFDEYGNIRGEFLFLDVVKTPLKDAAGNTIGTVGAARDVTDRKRIEKINLQQQQQIRMLGKAMEQSPVSIVITDINGSIEFVNPKFTEITGFSSEEALGQNPRILKSGLMDEQVYKDLWGDLVAGKQWFGEMHNRKKNGELFWEFSSISPILDETGKITHFIAVKEDITDHKRLISDYITAKNKAVEADRLKTAFLMNMSHEIRTPLNGIMGFSSLLATGEFETSEVSYYASIINKNSNRLLELINNIVDLSKIDAGSTEIEYRLVAPASRLSDLVHRFAIEIERAYLSVKVTVPEEHYYSSFETDAAKLDQILSSLISNAIKFTRVGGIEIGFKVDDDNIIFFVKDTGIGISPDNFTNIFDRFYQVDTSLTRGHEGAGLGLPICKGFVELLGGRIWVESEFGAGTTFYVSLPFRRNISMAIPDNSENREFQRIVKQQIKVLIVEDEYSIFQFLNIVLKKRNYTVLHAVDGTEAITLYKNSKNIDLILMDMKMPVMDGYRATQIIRNMNPGIPIIAVTAYAMAGDRDKALQAGCTDYLPKPVKKDALLSMIDKYL